MEGNKRKRDLKHYCPLLPGTNGNLTTVGGAGNQNMATGICLSRGIYYAKYYCGGVEGEITNEDLEKEKGL